MMRVALYYSPPEDSEFARCASRWLKCALEDLAEPVRRTHRDTLDGVQHYGFHATVKPPFRLTGDRSLYGLVEAVELFCRERRPFTAGRLKLSRLDNFLCLRLDSESGELSRFAEDVVRDFDGFRRPPDQRELERRLEKGLNARQHELLLRWGYPWVMDEFRFHFTLTGPLPDKPSRSAFSVLAEKYFSPVLNTQLQIDGISIFIQEEGSLFSCFHRCLF